MVCYGGAYFFGRKIIVIGAENGSELLKLQG